jgi:osmoprotectant transport system permease protein
MPDPEPLIRWDWLADRLDVLAFRTLEHVWLTVLAVTVGFAISFALALLIRRRPGSYTPITATAGVIYTIPSLALFAALVPITGLTVVTAEIALVSYTLLVLVRNIVAGLESVPPEVRETADAMGYTSSARLWRVELPLALPVIVAGLRIATVTTIGLVTVAALVGQGGLGFLITDGLRRFFPTLYVTGAVLSVLLAIAADALFVALQQFATPWTRARAAADGA